MDRKALYALPVKDLKQRARQEVAKAVRAGRKPAVRTLKCLDCGKAAEAYHHHNSYYEMLDVVPLCAKCHATKHGRDRRRRNAYVVELREQGLSYNNIAVRLFQEGWQPITQEGARQIVLRHEKRQRRSLANVQNLNREAGR